MQKSLSMFQPNHGWAEICDNCEHRHVNLNHNSETCCNKSTYKTWADLKRFADESETCDSYQGITEFNLAIEEKKYL